VALDRSPAVGLAEVLRTGGDFYQNSDWAFAYSLCEDLYHYEKSGKSSGQMFQTIYSAFERLLVAGGSAPCARQNLRNRSLNLRS
jgi:hypothetical protein